MLQTFLVCVQFYKHYAIKTYYCYLVPTPKVNLKFVFTTSHVLIRLAT